ncbi:MAG: hypothetical protein JXR63_08435 [Spirochaetales bacterium]|nr:hypothetical protein [Spirochaetales bacterium]
MKKLILAVAMIVPLVLVFLFSNIDGLLLEPEISPQEFLETMPHMEISLFGKSLVFTQPLSTLWVALLGLLMIAFGSVFLANRLGDAARSYWGIGLILWGLGAISAGISYQAFGYELKCAGRDFCLFTSDFEIVYMLLTCYSIAFFIAATAYASASGRSRRFLLCFAVADSVVYTILALVGAFLPVKFLISYEGFLVLTGGNFLLMFIFNILHYKKFKDSANLDFILIWIILNFVNIGYFAWLFAGISRPLYEKFGVWFNENDFLHVLLIFWAIFLFIRLKKSLKVSEKL